MQQGGGGVWRGGVQGAFGVLENLVLDLARDGVEFVLFDETLFDEELREVGERVAGGFGLAFAGGFVEALIIAE